MSWGNYYRGDSSFAINNYSSHCCCNVYSMPLNCAGLFLIYKKKHSFFFSGMCEAIELMLINASLRHGSVFFSVVQPSVISSCSKFPLSVIQRWMMMPCVTIGDRRLSNELFQNEN